jgi:hypothetical protein
MADDDPIARLRAEMDQARAGMTEFAGALWGFYSGLVDAGFTPEQAMTLTSELLVAQVSNWGDDSDE